MIDPSAASDDNWLLDEDEDDGGAAGLPAIDQRPWRVLVVDDDVDVHAVTRLALRNVSFKGRELELFSAYSGGEAFKVLRDTSDIALVLLDVVMETDDAGLILARRIREELGNQMVRVVLRTGQPGQAPEQRVIIEYDINDYKAKTELTTQKLFTTVISALRAYESLMMLERSRIGLGKILAGANNLYQAHSLREFASGVLNQVSAILDVGADGVLCVMAGAGDPSVVAATGGYAHLAELGTMPADHPLLPAIAKAFAEQRSQFEHPANVLFIHASDARALCLSVTPPWPLAAIQRDLLEVFCQRIAAAFDNLQLFGQLRQAQEATAVALAELAALRGQGGRGRRPQDLPARLARTLLARGSDDPELTPQLLEMIDLASILHDVGKACTPELTPELTSPDRFAAAPEGPRATQASAEIGHAILARAARMVDGVSHLRYAAQIALARHEHFDGAGYPAQLAGRAIPLCARIAAVVDVFDVPDLSEASEASEASEVSEVSDATRQGAPCAQSWPDAALLDQLRRRRGSQFDPEIVDALFEIVEADRPARPDERA